MSKRTKQCKRLKNLFSILHFLCLFGPLMYFVPYGFILGEPVQKICMSFTLIASVIVVAISTLVGATARAGLHRTVLWLILIGLMFTLTQIEVLIYVMGIVSILDELVFCKLKDKYKDAYAANVEIDRRM